MAHSVAIRGDDLYTRVYADSDTPWREVTGMDDDRLNELDVLVFDKATYTDELNAERDRLDAVFAKSIADKWFVVTWPEHVRNRRFNSDAEYSQPMPEAEARADADAVYGE